MLLNLNIFTTKRTKIYHKVHKAKPVDFHKDNNPLKDWGTQSFVFLVAWNRPERIAL